MNAIRVKKLLDSETLYLPEIKELIGKNVEIIVLEDESVSMPEEERRRRFLATAGTLDLDEKALKDLDDASMI